MLAPDAMWRREQEEKIVYGSVAEQAKKVSDPSGASVLAGVRGVNVGADEELFSKITTPNKGYRQSVDE